MLQDVTRAAGRQPQLVLHGTGLEINQISISIQIKSNRQWYSLRRIQSFLALDQLLGYRLLRPLGTTQRHRRSNDCCGSLLSCQATWSACCWVCVMGVSKLSNTHSIFAISLIDCTVRCSCSDRISLSMSTQCSLVQFVACSGAPAQSIAGSNILDVLSFFFSLTSSCYCRLWACWSTGLIQYNVGKASNTKCYIELMSSSSCFGLARLLCSEAFDFTQYH